MTENTANESAVLRDHLAGHRTVLANERTFLSYLRTSLTFFVSGLTFIRFFDNRTIEIVGIVFMPIALATLIAGVVSYVRMKSRIGTEVCDDNAADDARN